MTGTLLRRRDLLASGAAAIAAVHAGEATTRSLADWPLLTSQFAVPDWFRDAKLGLEAHWGPQCVPEFGDWYARKMYIQGDPFYDHHLRTYGHPSRTGFIDIIGRWRAERWNPGELLDLYVDAGARYFAAMAGHHDNFDNYASTHHGWNSVRVGPKRDIVGTWRRLARARGLPYGVTIHTAHAWHWQQAAYGYDAEGPLAGVRYDAARLRRRDGRGTWWEGLDPQELYTGPSMAAPSGLRSIQAMNDWHASHDRVWTEEPPVVNPAFVARWRLRILELIDVYRPDLLYFDDTGLPLGQAGLDVVDHFYRTNRARHGGLLQGVVTGKKLDDAQRRAIVENVKRGVVDDLRAVPWQASTCIGDWHYDRKLYDRHGYKAIETVARMLCDIVAKNGNLLLNIPLRGDGTIDEDERAFLADLARWTRTNGEGIYASRPWHRYGEGPMRAGGGMFGEKAPLAYGGRDIRFTTRGATLYAFLLAPPADGRVTITSLPASPDYRVERVELLGRPGPLACHSDAAGLHVALPAGSEPVPGLRLSGFNLAPLAGNRQRPEAVVRP